MKKLVAWVLCAFLCCSVFIIHAYAREGWFVEAVGGQAFYREMDGDGVLVAVVGAGVCETEELAGKIAGFKNYTAQEAADANGMDTKAASLIAADGCGIAPAASILSVKVATDSETRRSDCAQGIVYAADMGADVILYLAEPDTLQTSTGVMASALAYAKECGAVVVAPYSRGGGVQSPDITLAGGFGEGFSAMEGSENAAVCAPGSGVPVAVGGSSAAVVGHYAAAAAVAGYAAAGMSRYSIGAQQALNALLQSTQSINSMRVMDVSAAFSRYERGENGTEDGTETMELGREYEFSILLGETRHYTFSLPEMVKTSLTFEKASGEYFARLFQKGSDYPLWTAQYCGQGLSEMLPAGEYTVELTAVSAASGRILWEAQVPDIVLSGSKAQENGAEAGYAFNVALEEAAQFKLWVLNEAEEKVFEYSGRGVKGENAVSWSLPGGALTGGYTAYAVSSNFAGEKQAQPLRFSLEARPSILSLSYSALFNPMVGGNYLELELDYAADMEVYALDAAGASYPIASGRYRPGVNTIVWSGQSGTGEYLPAGQYRVFFEGEKGALRETVLVTIWYEELQADSFYAAVEKTDAGESLAVYFRSSLACDAELTVVNTANGSVAAYAAQGYETDGVQRISCAIDVLTDGFYEFAAAVGESGGETALVEYRGGFAIDRGKGSVTLQQGSKASGTSGDNGQGGALDTGYEEEERETAEEIPYYSLLLCCLVLCVMVVYDRLKRKRKSEEIS